MQNLMKLLRDRKTPMLTMQHFQLSLENVSVYLSHTQSASGVAAHSVIKSSLLSVQVAFYMNYI